MSPMKEVDRHIGIVTLGASSSSAASHSSIIKYRSSSKRGVISKILTELWSFFDLVFGIWYGLSIQRVKPVLSCKLKTTLYVQLRG